MHVCGALAAREPSKKRATPPKDNERLQRFPHRQHIAVSARARACIRTGTGSPSRGLWVLFHGHRHLLFRSLSGPWRRWGATGPRRRRSGHAAQPSRQPGHAQVVTMCSGARLLSSPFGFTLHPSPAPAAAAALQTTRPDQCQGTAELAALRGAGAEVPSNGWCRSKTKLHPQHIQLECKSCQGGGMPRALMPAGPGPLVCAPHSLSCAWCAPPRSFCLLSFALFSLLPPPLPFPPRIPTHPFACPAGGRQQRASRSARKVGAEPGTHAQAAPSVRAPLPAAPFLHLHLLAPARCFGFGPLLSPLCRDLSPVPPEPRSSHCVTTSLCTTRPTERQAGHA